jgi:hypothetical protein
VRGRLREGRGVGREGDRRVRRLRILSLGLGRIFLQPKLDNRKQGEAKNSRRA